MPYCGAAQVPVLIAPQLIPQAQGYGAAGLQWHAYGDSLRQALGERWPQYEGFVFALATGAVVRLIAPLLGDKATDPAVVVVDEGGQFAISLCGGHRGGADALARTVGHYLTATPVLTGAANGNQVSALDLWGRPFGWHLGAGDWTGVSSLLAREQPVAVVQEAGTQLWRQGLPPQWQQSLPPAAPGEAVIPGPGGPQGRVWITPRAPQENASLPEVWWHPRVLWIGIGCERGTPQALISAAIAQVCQHHGLALGAIAGIATLDLKADEVGLVTLCQGQQWPMVCFSPEQLRTIPVPHPSAVVAQAVGTPSVAEAAAIAAAWNHSRPWNDFASPLETTGPKSSAPLLVSKQVIRDPNSAGAVTVAIAQAQREWIGAKGHIALVGTGPGDLGQLTAAAKGAIGQGDVVIGYSLYVDLIRPLLSPGQIVEALPITQEQDRADRAIALARWGLSVVVISSGDCGIYAMAGLVLETLQAQGWDGHSPAVTSYPGISALQAAAARVGAPLMHDFCAISLSDLLTPWAVIEHRLRAAAEADFVVALYNPKSQKRTEQIAIAQRYFAQHRSPQTPVAIVRSAYRPDERIILTTVADMLHHPIDMVTVVIIGNRSTQLYQGKIITPRGYRQRQ